MDAFARKVPFQETTASVLLDGARILAALVVCCGHWRNLFFVSWPELTLPHHALYLPLYLLTSGGHQAVMVFFVLSGYLVGGSIFRAMGSGRWSWEDYLTRRLVRLWIVLIPALLLCALMDGTGMSLHLAPALYSGQIHNGMGIDPAANLTWQNGLGSLFFVQEIFTRSLGSDTPLWSLANEFWYYLLFPLALIALRSGARSWNRLLCGALAAGIAVLVGRPILELFPVWIAGAVMAAVPVPAIGRALRSAVWVLYPILFFALSKHTVVSPVVSDYILGAATVLFFLCLLQCTGRAPAAAWTRLARTGAAFSYTLYLVHLPALVLLSSLMARDSRWQPDAVHLLLAAAALVAVIGYAWGVAALTEFRTDTVRRRISAVLPPRLSRRRESLAA